MANSYQYWQLPAKEQRKDESSLSLKTADKVPSPGPDDVLLRVHAVSLNYRDLIIARNMYPLAVREDTLVPVSDGAGEIVEVGDRVNKFKKGDRAAANFNIAHLHGSTCSKLEEKYALGGAIGGMLAQYVVLPANAVVHIPKALSYEEAATLPCAAVTAWNGLHGLNDVPLLPGATVALEGTGGVSVFAAQLAIAAGAKAVITSSSDDKIERVRSLFTKEQQERLFTVNYKKTPDWDKEVLRVSNGEGASHIIEVGGPGTLEKAHACIKRGGVIANIGFVAQGETPNIPVLNLTSSSIYRGFLVGSVDMFENLNACIEVNHIKPLVDKVFEFNDAPKAYAYQWSQAHVGKVVIKV
jgi:NADPH:quinone reductase-like Zn-dependent oxidoreductase